MRRVLAAVVAGGVLSIAGAQGVPSLDTNRVMNIQMSAQGGVSAPVDSIARLDTDATNFLVYLRSGSVLTIARAQIQKVHFSQTAITAARDPAGRPHRANGPSVVRRSLGIVTIVLPNAVAGAAQVQVLDFRGRVVRSLAVAGRTEVAWDGCRDAGTLVAAGVYTIRCTMSGQPVFTRTIAIQ